MVLYLPTASTFVPWTILFRRFSSRHIFNSIVYSLPSLAGALVHGTSIEMLTRNKIRYYLPVLKRRPMLSPYTIHASPLILGFDGSLLLWNFFRNLPRQMKLHFFCHVHSLRTTEAVRYLQIGGFYFPVYYNIVTVIPSVSLQRTKHELFNLSRFLPIGNSSEQIHSSSELWSRHSFTAVPCPSLHYRYNTVHRHHSSFFFVKRPVCQK
jgi:hypothetical protein